MQPFADSDGGEILSVRKGKGDWIGSIPHAAFSSSEPSDVGRLVGVCSVFPIRVFPLVRLYTCPHPGCRRS